MGGQLSVQNCCAPDRETFYQSFAFLWTFAGRDKGPFDSIQQVPASSSDGTLTLASPKHSYFTEVPTYSSQPVSRPRCKFGDACNRGNPTHFVEQSHPGDPDAEEAGVQVPQVKPGPALHSRNGSFDWIRTANEKEDRDLRAQTATLTLKACRACGYQLSAGGVVPLRHTDMMVEGSDCQKVGNLRGLEVWQGANAYHPCGGFRTGGRHALEESMCVQSTLSLSLQRALYISRHGNAQVSVPERLKRDQRSEWFCYIPETGGILSPKVEVFRKGSAEGYGFLPSPVELASVVSVAMPNKNPNVKDSPLDAPESPDEYRALLVAKLKVALGAAAMSGASACVVPGLGCGVFKNDPGDVGAALGEAIAWAPLCGKLQEVILAGVPKALEAAARR
ncbi:Retrovirus-related Pol polyprotein from transposon TNT 1-94 [Durusdinium trenchii]